MAVCFQLASLIARMLRRERTPATTRIASWDINVKGIDDAAVRIGGVALVRYDGITLLRFEVTVQLLRP